jgi:hypothetical protein
MALKACPCCDYLTIDKSGDFDICPVCGWEDDGLNPEKPEHLDAGRGGPNGMTLRQGRKKFASLIAKSGVPPEAAQFKHLARNIPL